MEKTTNVKALAGRAVAMVTGGRADHALIYIRDTAKDGVTACAATLASPATGRS